MKNIPNTYVKGVTRMAGVATKRYYMVYMVYMEYMANMEYMEYMTDTPKEGKI